MKRFLTFTFSILIGCLSLMAEAYTPQTVPNPRTADAHSNVCNPDAILSPEEVVQLQAVCDKIDHYSEVELAVVALADIGEADAYDFSLELFNHWGIGRKGRNTGVLLFLTTGTRRVQIITGTGIEGILPDGECSLTIDEMIDDLRANRWGPGLIAGAKSIGRKVTTQAAREELLLDHTLPEPSGAPWNWMAWLTALGGIGYFFHYYLKRPCPRCKERTLKVRKEIIRPATTRATGLGANHYTCTHCGHTFSENFTIPRRPEPPSGGAPIIIGGGGYRGGGGGFSGGSFGGGFSGGGGAGRSF